MTQRFNQIVNNLETSLKLFNQNKQSLSLKLNTAVNEDKTNYIIKKTQLPKKSFFDKKEWIPGASSYPWIISLLFISGILENIF